LGFELLVLAHGGGEGGGDGSGGLRRWVGHGHLWSTARTLRDCDDEGTFTPLAVGVGHPMEPTRVWERVVWIKWIGHLASSVYDAAIMVHEETS
jgi:hypothetical protein